MLGRITLWTILALSTIGRFSGIAQAYGSNRPLRVGMLKMDRELDGQKPLSTIQPGGWIIQQNKTLIGAINDEWIVAFDSDTRSVRWLKKIPYPVSNEPLLIGNQILFSIRNGRIMLLNTKDGSQIWDLEVDSYINRPFVVRNGVLYAVSAGQYIYAINMETGKKQWLHNTEFGGGLTIAKPSTPVLADGKLFVGLPSGELTVLDAKSGTGIKRFNPKTSDARFKDFHGELKVDGESLFVSRYDGLIAKIEWDQGVNGKVIWEQNVDSVSASALGKDLAYSGSVSGKVSAFELGNGKKIWEAVIGESIGEITIHGDKVIVTGTQGRVTVLDKGAGKIVWYDDLGSAITTKPNISNNLMWITTSHNNLYAYQLN